MVTIHRRGQKHTLEPIAQVLARADQALQILGRYKARLDSVSGSLSALEVEDLVTVRDVATVLQRAEMVRRVSEEIEGYVVELGADGRLVMLQLEELIGGVEEDRRLVAKDYFHESGDFELLNVMNDLAAPRRRRSCSTCTTSPRCCTSAPGSASTARCSRVGSGSCTRSRVCPRSCPTTWLHDSRTCRRSCAPGSPTSPKSTVSARCAHARSRKGSSRLAETSILERYV